MKLAVYQPWGSLSRLHDELNRLFDLRTPFDGEEAAPVNYWTPAVDVKEEADRFMVRADVPGVDPKDIEITLENGVLTIRGERKMEKKEEREGWSRVERVYGSFYRRMALPNTGDADGVKARTDQGVLEIEIPKKKETLPRKIPVSG
jgi:HSP20 family protein